MQKKKQGCIAEVREVVRLLANEFDQCVTSLENVVRVINTLEEENRYLKSELQEKLEIISALSLDDIEKQLTSQPVQNKNTMEEENKLLKSELQKIN